MEYCNDSELNDLFDSACDKAKMIAAVRNERNVGYKTRNQRSGRFQNLRKTFAGRDEGDENRGWKQQIAGPVKFRVFADVCRECTNNTDMLRKDLHSFPKYPNKPRTDRKSSEGKGVWQKRRVNAVTNEQEANGSLTESDRQSIRSYAESQRGVHLPH